MQKKYQDKGVVLVALSDEPKTKVWPYISKHKLPYIVGGDARSTLEAFGIKGFPTMFLLDPEGKVAWVGHPMQVEESLDKLLKDKPPKGGGISAEQNAGAEFKAAGKLLKRKKYAEAFAAYQKIVSTYAGTKSAKKAATEIKKMKADEAIMKTIAQVVEKKGKGWLEAARALAKAGETEDAIRYYDKIIEQCGDTEYAKLAEDERAKLKPEGGKKKSSKA